MDMFRFTARQLEIFLAVCDHGGFRKAADALQVSEANISNHMRLLESQLGIELFQRRSGASIALSATGAAFREDAQAFVKLGLELGRRWRSPSSETVSLRLYVGDHILEDFVRPVLSDFLYQNPDISFTFQRYASRDDVRRALKTGELDGAVMTVRSEAELPDSILLSTIGTGVYGIAAVADIARAKGLGNVEFLISADEVNGIAVYERELRPFGVNKIKVAARYPYHDVGVDMALQGLGAIALLDSIVQKFDPAGELVLIQRMLDWERRIALPDSLSEEQSRRIRDFFAGVLE